MDNCICVLNQIYIISPFFEYPYLKDIFDILILGGPTTTVPPPLPSQNQSSLTNHNPADFRYSGTELVMLYDYKVNF